jgi:hypothetical protein
LCKRDNQQKDRKTTFITKTVERHTDKFCVKELIHTKTERTFFNKESISASQTLRRQSQSHTCSSFFSNFFVLIIFFGYTRIIHYFYFCLSRASNLLCVIFYRSTDRQNKKNSFLFCLSVFLSFCLSVFLSFCLFVFLSICLFVFLSFCLFVFLSFCLFVFLSFCLFVFLSFCLFVFLSFCLSVFLSFYLYVFMYSIFLSFYLSVFLSFFSFLIIAKCLTSFDSETGFNNIPPHLSFVVSTQSILKVQF